MEEKQIEEIAGALKFCKDTPIEKCNTKKDCSHCMAEQIYNAGYRKQEWICVDDRLPTWEDGKVLIYTAYGISIAERTVKGHWKGLCAIPKLITHWMYLPEPPKGE